MEKDGSADAARNLKLTRQARQDLANEDDPPRAFVGLLRRSPLNFVFASSSTAQHLTLNLHRLRLHLSTLSSQ